MQMIKTQQQIDNKLSPATSMSSRNLDSSGIKARLPAL
jgi:hypothetical protein